ncbi:ABC transporter substrate-binding protein [Burkholderia cenocepacia]|uniref:ABC transporter substrate-binding protein n=1 Tax=Burkholderia cenocepacia TaxID=95486 RepID=UPI00190595B5|nr:ABC transporter substrate-binding protein [Burkholderia cenocepacia]MBJ9696808.1 ABC transporter substrate-binding protein [Burkholderia cenocepacia]
MRLLVIRSAVRFSLAAAVLLAVPLSVYSQEANVPTGKVFDEQVALMTVKPQGPVDQPWMQHVGGALADISKYKKKGPYTLCFSNASVNNPWRVQGWKIMQAERDVQRADIKGFDYADAQGRDEKQISDIRSLVNSGRCDALIVSPNTAAALTPVVEEACGKLPVITFDRPVNSTCPVTDVRAVGGYAWGKVSADYVVHNVPREGRVLALRTMPGVDLFETRWAAARRVFDAAGIKPVGVEFVGADLAKTKAVVADYLSRGIKIDAVWVDFGTVSTAAAEAFEDAGLPYPVITGEDQQSYLQAWKRDGFKGIAPTYPVYMWRTAVVAALKVLKGEPVPAPVWTLPQPVITQADLPKYVSDKVSPLNYSMCGCDKLPGYPQR